jgi:alanine racemase
MRPTRAVVDLSCIAHNVRALRAVTAPEVRQMAVVKADAYGHGAVPVARTAMEAGADWLGVALVEEGLQLREAGLSAPILVLGAIFAGDAEAAVAASLSVAVWDRESALALEAAGRAAGTPAPVHVKVDTGMGRLGIRPDEAAEFAFWIAGLPGLRLEGVFSHLAAADEADLGFARRQLAELRGVLAAMSGRGVRVGLRHVANTAATIALPDSHLDLVRTGIGLYGLHPSPAVPHTVELRPAMSLRTRIAQLKSVGPGVPLSYGATFVTRRPSRIATLPVGYGDGYPRLLSNRGEVLLHGRRAPIVGRVCMDMLLADATEIPGVETGDEAVLFGRQGDEVIGAEELAEAVGTIHYEITCGVGSRVPREYV